MSDNLKNNILIALMVLALIVICLFSAYASGAFDRDTGGEKTAPLEKSDGTAELTGDGGEASESENNAGGAASASDGGASFSQGVPEIPLKTGELGNSLRPEASIPGTEYLYRTSYIIANPEDITCIVNRTYNLSSDYCPEDLVYCSIPFAPGREDSVHYVRAEMNEALQEMYNAAKAEGLDFCGASGYRSYDIQRIHFQKKIQVKGSVEEASLYNAAPGQSEHQLGLAMDFTTEALGFETRTDFENTEEGKWLLAHCAEYGFILRYPANAEDITRYSYEPWHYRYVGKQLAAVIMKRGITLEEYYGLVK